VCGVNAPARKDEGASEPTQAGEQRLIAGVAPLLPGDRLALRAAAPLTAKRPQRAADFGLFDLAQRDQLDLFQPKESHP
jgi:hypothetical protein